MFYVFFSMFSLINWFFFVSMDMLTWTPMLFFYSFPPPHSSVVICAPGSFMHTHAVLLNTPGSKYSLSMSRVVVAPCVAPW